MQLHQLIQVSLKTAFPSVQQNVFFYFNSFCCWHHGCGGGPSLPCHSPGFCSCPACSAWWDSSPPESVRTPKPNRESLSGTTPTMRPPTTSPLPGCWWTSTGRMCLYGRGVERCRSHCRHSNSPWIEKQEGASEITEAHTWIQVFPQRVTINSTNISFTRTPAVHLHR